jgi:hypothetical protein
MKKIIKTLFSKFIFRNFKRKFLNFRNRDARGDVEIGEIEKEKLFIYLYLIIMPKVDYNNISADFAKSRKNMKWEEIEYFLEKYSSFLE